jgi:transposase
MYLRETSRTNKDGTKVTYLQLAHNERNDAGVSTAKVIHNFGRADAIDRDGLGRLVKSISRFLDPGDAVAAASAGDVRVVESRPVGTAFVLDKLWRTLGIDKAITAVTQGRKLNPHIERIVFAMVANRAIEPLSKLAATRWATERVALPGVGGFNEDACYRAMDELLAIEPELAKTIYWSTADLLNLEVDLLFFDTSSTYFETDRCDERTDEDSEDAEIDDDETTVGFRAYGKSKDHRPDLPQVVIGMAVTRTGIPIRVWTWPGNTADSELIRQVKDDLASWKLGRAVWVADRGFSSEENRRYLQRAGGHYIIGEKLRGESKEAALALSHKGRYKTVRDNLEVKEVIIDDGTMRDRFVICRNPDQARKDKVVRDQVIDRLTAKIDGSDKLSAQQRVVLATKLRQKPSYNRFLRETAAGLLRIDKAAVARDAHFDGKFLLRTSDPTLSSEDVALGYKQLLEVERGWRDMKSTLDLRPVYHHLEDRIRAHVILCWLALLLIRVAETKIGDTWRNIRNELQRMHAVTLVTDSGVVCQCSEPTAKHKSIFAALGLAEPPRFFEFHPSQD